MGVRLSHRSYNVRPVKTAALEQTLRDHPGDLASWQVYGGWLLEQGDVRGELIRLEQRRRRVSPADGEVLERQIAALERAHQQGWDAAVPPEVTVLERRYGFATKVSVEWSDDAPAVVEQALRERFVTALRLAPVDVGDEDDWEWDDETGEPIPPPLADAGILATLDLGQLTELDLSYLRLGEPGAEALAASTTTGRIETLDLRYCGIGDAGLTALAASACLDRVRCLRLQSNALSAEGVRALQRIERLTELDLRYNEIGAAGAQALLAAPFIGSLTRLLLYRTDVTDAGVQQLASQLPPALRSYWRSV